MSSKSHASKSNVKTPEPKSRSVKATDTVKPTVKAGKSKQTKPAVTEKTVRAAGSEKAAKAASSEKTKKAAVRSTGQEKSAKSAAAKSAKTPAAAKTSKKSKAYKKTEETKSDYQGIRTPQVLKLLEQDKSASNPVILAGKSRIPRMLSGREPLSRIMKREMGEVFSDIDDTVVVNLTQLAIEYEAPQILDRFNACSCDKCVEIFSCAIAKRVPARFARVTKGADLRTGGRGSRELMERMDPVRKKVVTEMIKELIGNKKRCFHDDTDNESKE